LDDWAIGVRSLAEAADSLIEESAWKLLKNYLFK
jgi:hypothetical protein